MDGQTKLFVYGSLLRPTGIRDVDAAMSRVGRDLGRASLIGKLYDLGDYPGAVPMGSASPLPAGAADHAIVAQTSGSFQSAGVSAPRVWGKLFAVKNPDELFSVLDAYEGFHALAPELSEFVRTESEAVSAQDGTFHSAFVYYYNRSVVGFTPIDSGDYAAYRGFPA